MAYIRRRFTGRRPSFRRPKRPGAWTGNAFMNVTLAANTITSYYLMDDLTVDRLNAAGKLYHQRTVYWFACKANTSGARADVGFYIARFQTDIANNVPSSAIWPAIPIGTTSPAYTTEWFEKDMMEYQYRLVQGGTGSGAFPDITNDFNYQRDVKAKRKLDDTDAVLFTITANSPIIFSFVFRSYYSW